MNTRQVPQREYAKTIRISEYNRTETNNLFIGGWESFDLDVFCGRKSKIEVETRKPKQLQDEKVS